MNFHKHKNKRGFLPFRSTDRQGLKPYPSHNRGTAKRAGAEMRRASGERRPRLTSRPRPSAAEDGFWRLGQRKWGQSVGRSVRWFVWGSSAFGVASGGVSKLQAAICLLRKYEETIDAGQPGKVPERDAARNAEFQVGELSIAVDS